jgi:hypothetical protein
MPNSNTTILEWQDSVNQIWHAKLFNHSSSVQVTSLGWSVCRHALQCKMQLLGKRKLTSPEFLQMNCSSS